ncbi:MAG: hemerythrin domain-containing protein [Bacteroidales bacterium]|jgi:hemerythrin-like domain-containing protein|nr:hemerythrin domain-containing protein [Bacteroidales bacterium]
MKKNNPVTEMSPVVSGMLSLHKIISRSLNISIGKCDEYIVKQGVPSGEVKGFSLYLSNLSRITHSHHLSEDDIVFPYLEDYIDAPYKLLKDDHNDMARILEALDQSIMELSSGGIDRLRVVLDEFDKLWGPHIKMEEESFTSEKLKAVIGMKEQEAIIQKLGEHGLKNAGPGHFALPFLFYNLEGKDREDFMESIPWIVKKVLVPVIWKNQWKPMRPFLL